MRNTTNRLTGEGAKDVSASKNGDSGAISIYRFRNFVEKMEAVEQLTKLCIDKNGR